MSLKTTDSKIFNLIKSEEKRQKETICLIASENYCSAAVREAIGSVLTNKYSEGYPHKRYYAGQINADQIEEIAKERALKMFGLSDEKWHANVQPYSGSPANAEIYLALLEFGDTVMGMRLDQGGHITHGLPISFSGRAYKFVSYGVDPKTEKLDYDEILKIAKECKPKLIVCGATAYSRIIDFKKFREIADAVGALLLADISHIAGLIVGGAHPSCFPYADIAMTTTHKTLRGPRSAIIICKTELAEKIDKAVFPGFQGGPHDHITAAKAVCFAEAMTASFKKYSANIVKNCQALAKELQKGGLRIVSGGTDNHLVLVDLRPLKITGKIAQLALEEVGIVVNKNTIPNDPEKPFVTSGLRLGAAAITTRGMAEGEMQKIASLIVRTLEKYDDITHKKKIASEVKKLATAFPVPN
ncbi:serine hydroxymethyltransferase [Candidatus Berkelbacteria bacterium CG10_big_fil_rev_8_21_14_0_10_43_13]|uniref:Serine hydroxymethyltransferase n=1 Tax=Candidatus Berkelbacteria bacterium CG10_big_fil_rev_8_21_14_0_10_43_13 TaxID=1974514 RepID=A0A2H0W6L3_9BACT|nr:MAG: serine hydroxymethyltransferase [Candidatus Berkelbacteria bacterium CG10_big_fil_rev_8_21_14_0_10_43_13]